MKICPKCGAEHSKPGIFCSRKCANSRNFSEEARQKKAEAMERYKERTPRSVFEERGKRSGEVVHRKWVEETLSKSFDELSPAQKRFCVETEQKGCCSECGTGTIWNGKPLKLEIDHIDGNPENNSRENLRAICPNCHQQTPTYKGRNVRRYLDEDILPEILEGGTINSILSRLGMNPGGNNRARIRQLAELHGIELP